MALANCMYHSTSWLGVFSDCQADANWNLTHCAARLLTAQVFQMAEAHAHLLFPGDGLVIALEH